MRFLAILIAIAPAYAGGITFGTNIIANGDAESGIGSNDGSVVASIPGWVTLNGNFTVVQYGASGGFPTLSDPGPASRGNNFFAGGPGTGIGSGDQNVDVSSIATQIDAGTVTFVMSGYFGGFDTQLDNAQLVAYFRDGSNAILNPSGFILQGPNAAARSNQTGLLFETTNGAIPVGTRDIEFVLNMFFVTGSYNDGYADNLSFVPNNASTAPTGTPEPGTNLLLGAGLLATAAFSKYRYSCSARTRRSTDR
jgi:hypothetical protein